MFEYVLTNTQYYQDIADAIRRKKSEIDKKLVSIAVTTPPTKTSYKATEEVSYSGLVVTATYDNNTTENVTSKCNFNLASGSKITGDTTVRITYKHNDISKTVTFDLTAIKLQSLAITSQPTKVDYSSGETMSLNGLVVTATWSDETTGNVTNNCSYSYPSGTLMTTDGVSNHSKNYNNIIYYTEGNITKQVNYIGLIKSILISLAITTQPTKTSYALGEYFDETGMVVEATFNNYTTSVAYDCNERNTRFTSTGTKTITVSYTWNGVTKTATTSVTVGAKALRNITITTQPTKRTYTEGESLSLSGMVVTATYTDDSTGTVTGWTASPANGSTLSEIGTKTITISYTTGGVTKSTTTTVTVEEAGTYVNGVKIVPWSTGTDAEIADMVTGAEQGKINLTDYWNVGDERTVHINEIPAKVVDSSGTNTLERQAEQDVILVLMDKDNNRYPYRNSYTSGRIKPYFIVGTKNCLRSAGAISKNVPTYPTWSFTDRENWGSELLNAFPSYYKDTIFHEVTLKSGEYDSTTSTHNASKWFLPTETEVFGTQRYSMTTESDLKRWEYYETEENCKKKSTGSTLYSTWWLRSVYKNGGSSWVYVLTAGTVGGFAPYENTMGIAPCFAI